MIVMVVMMKMIVVAKMMIVVVMMMVTIIIVIVVVVMMTAGDARLSDTPRGLKKSVAKYVAKAKKGDTAQCPGTSFKELQYLFALAKTICTIHF